MPPKYMIRETDLGWCIFVKRDETWVNIGWGPWAARADAEGALKAHVNRTLQSEERERARRIDATFYNEVGVRTQFAGAGAMGAV